MDDSYALAIDLGASGGKLFVGKLKGLRAEFVPVHQFENRIVHARGRSYWDFLHILHEIKTGYVKAQHEYEGNIKSIAIDSWSNDYAGDLRTVDVHIRRLREKIESDPARPEYILTKWGVGYYFAH